MVYKIYIDTFCRGEGFMCYQTGPTIVNVHLSKRNEREENKPGIWDASMSCC